MALCMVTPEVMETRSCLVPARGRDDGRATQRKKSTSLPKLPSWCVSPQYINKSRILMDTTKNFFLASIPSILISYPNSTSCFFLAARHRTTRDSSLSGRGGAVGGRLCARLAHTRCNLEVSKSRQSLKRPDLARNTVALVGWAPFGLPVP